jgi:hypothetical protein
MNMDSISLVRHGDIDGLISFAFENGLQHQLFSDTLIDNNGVQIPRFPLLDINPNDVEDWLLCHQVEHQAMSAALGLSNPVNLMDANWNDESSFYDWISTHLSLHQQIVVALGL